MNKTAGNIFQERSSFPFAPRTVAVWLLLKGLKTLALKNYEVKFDQESSLYLHEIKCSLNREKLVQFLR